MNPHILKARLDNDALSLRVNLDRWWNDIGLDLDDEVSGALRRVGRT